MLNRLWQLSYDSPTIDVLRNSKYAIPLIQSVHLFGITLILAAAVILNFRLLGWGLTALPFRTLAQESWRWSRVGLSLAVASGYRLKPCRLSEASTDGSGSKGFSLEESLKASTAAGLPCRYGCSDSISGRNRTLDEVTAPA